MTRRCEIIQWLSIFFGFAIHHNLQYYQYPQYWYDTNTNTIPIPIYIPIPLLLCVWNCPTIYFGFAIRYFSILSFLVLPDTWRHLKNIWTQIGDRMLSTFWSPISSTDVHILSICPPAMQMIVQRYRATYGKQYGQHTVKHTNNTDHIRQTIQTVRGNIRQRGNQCDIAGDKSTDYPRSSIITTAYHIAICTRCSNNRKCWQKYNSGDITDWVQMSHCQVFQQIAWFVKRWHELYSLSEPPAHKVKITIKPQWKS